MKLKRVLKVNCNIAKVLTLALKCKHLCQRNIKKILSSDFAIKFPFFSFFPTSGMLVVIVLLLIAIVVVGVWPV